MTPIFIWTCVDHISVRLDSIYLQKCAISVFDFCITDHSMVGLIVKDVGAKTVKQSGKNLYRTRVDFEKLKNRLLWEFWECVFVEENLEIAYVNFFNCLNNHISNCTIKTPIKKSEKFLQPWMTKSLLRKIKKKNKSNKRRLKRPNNKKPKRKHKRLVKKTKKQISSHKNNFYRKKLIKHKGNLKKEWEVINNILNRSEKNNIISLVHNNEEVKDSEKIAKIANTTMIAHTILQKILALIMSLVRVVQIVLSLKLYLNLNI